jgi:hypothetical protein
MSAWGSWLGGNAGTAWLRAIACEGRMNEFQLNLALLTLGTGTRGSVVVKALCYKPEGRGFDTRWGEFLNLPNPSGPGVYSAPNRNEYQKH